MDAVTARSPVKLAFGSSRNICRARANGSSPVSCGAGRKNLPIIGLPLANVQLRQNHARAARGDVEDAKAHLEDLGRARCPISNGRRRSFLYAETIGAFSSYRR